MEEKRTCLYTTPNNQPDRIEITYEFADLPEEIIINFLLRLPVKSVLKFKCVSKSWFSLFCSPYFIRAHLEISSRNPNFTDHRIMFAFSTGIAYHNQLWVKQCSVSSLMLESPTVAFDVDHPAKNESNESGGSIVGSCNGIICVAIRNIFLWNPSTRKSTKLPAFGRCLRAIRFGFGYNEYNDDYKVVAIFEEYPTLMVVKIYSLRTNCWKRIEDFSYGNPLNGMGKFASGRLHFKAISPKKLCNIVSLDLKSESYAIVEQPNYGDGPFHYTLQLLGGCLSLLSNLPGIRADVWVMKEYGVKESWTRVVSIPYFNGPHEYWYSNPLMIMRNGEILLVQVGDESFVVYNPKDNCLRRHMVSNAQGFSTASIYVESLVPL